MHAASQDVPDILDATTTREGKSAFLVSLSRLDAALPRIMGGDADLGDLTPRDPRGIGVSGGYPQVNTGINEPSPFLLKRAYMRSAAARILVDRIAADTWGEWLKVTVKDDGDELKEALEARFKNPTGRPGARPIWWHMEQADKLARRDGRSLLFFGLGDAEGDASKEPAQVRGLRYIQVIPQASITGVELETDDTSPDYQQPQYWLVNASAPVQGGRAPLPRKIHASRVVPFIPVPREDDEWNGTSVLAPAINYIEWKENLNWASAEAYFQQAAPFVIVKMEKDVQLNQQEKLDVKNEVKKMQQGLTQRIFLKGIEVTTLSEAGSLPDPTPHNQIAMENLAMILGIPRSMLTGDAAGELAASQEDSRRYAARLSKIQEQYADPLMRALVARLESWEFLLWDEAEESSIDFEWNPIDEPTTGQKAEAEVRLASARRIYKDAGLPIPAALAYDAVEWPDDPNPEPVAPKLKPAFPFGTPPAQSAAKQVPVAPGAVNEPDAKGDAATVPGPIAPRGLMRTIDDAAEEVALVFKRAYREAARGLDDTAASIGAAAARLKRGIEQDLPLVIVPNVKRAFNVGARATRKSLKPRHAPEGDAFKDDDPDFYGENYVYAQPARELARDVGVRVSDRLRARLTEGLQDGVGLHAMKGMLREEYELSNADADRIARTESLRAYNSATRDAMKEAGYTDFIFAAYAGADPVCSELDGQRVSIDDIDQRPPIHPNCRCTLRAAIPGRDVRMRGVTIDGAVAYVVEAN